MIYSVNRKCFFEEISDINDEPGIKRLLSTNFTNDHELNELIFSFMAK